MDMTQLTTVVSLLIALSIASERLVEIIKGFIPALDQQNEDPSKDGRRRAVLQILAVVAGIVTAFLFRRLEREAREQRRGLWNSLGPR